MIRQKLLKVLKGKTMSKLDKGIEMKWQHTIMKWVYKEVDPGINKLKFYFF